MSSRDRIAMTPQEIEDYLAANRKVQVATVGKEGAPHLSTLFYTLHEGRIAFTTYAKSQKVVNLARNPAMTCLVEDGMAYEELRGVVLHGEGRVSHDPDLRMDVGARVAAVMTGLTPEAAQDPAFRDGVAAALAKRVTVIMEPTRIASWDHGKL